MKKLRIFTVLSLLLLIGNLSFGQNDMAETKMVGGAEMYPSKDIVENAVNSQDHTTLVAAVKAAELVDILKSDGPFTVFAPTNSAFEDLPAGTVESLLKKENQKKLQAVLTYHVLAGDYKAGDIVNAIQKGNGKASFATVNGGKVSAMLDGNQVKLQDVAGNVATVTTADVDQSNGVIHVIDSVLLPAD
ncbi:fasciclin domain-containing protein [Gramella sp. KN1008]|uniref:fasciclin domain-containing protein n=1 Tax=Gramella sp. KN1008 TaxID=2529298 RepID=UPI001040D851|nr:fasciclin domain-containing protein [Gramella sp. KN1008]TBW28402.1 fasciclin domain-containing protein [Gramella sp. KN1008]